MTSRHTLGPVLRADAAVPACLADLVSEAALLAAHDAGSAGAHHEVSEDLDALLRELVDRGAPAWVAERVDQLAQQHLAAGDELGEAADRRLDVLEWLRDRGPIAPQPATTGDDRTVAQGRTLRLVPHPETGPDGR